MTQHRPPTIPLNASTAPAPSAARQLPDIASALPWRTWTEGLAEARRRRVPILALAEAPWANSAQRIALVLGRDEALRARWSEEVVPVLLDPFARPDLAAAWRAAAVALTGTAGPPLLAFLTHEGLPILTYGTMTLEGDDTFPSLASLIQATAEAYAGEPAAVLDEARQLDASLRAAAQAPAWAVDWDAVRPELDLTHGGFLALPKHPRPEVLRALLEVHAEGAAPDELVVWLTTTLDGMTRGGIADQLDRGFHRCARDRRWTLPHFEKPLPLNAQLGAVYARAAVALRQPRWLAIAEQVLALCLTGLRDGVDVIGADAEYYTWTAKEILSTLDPALVQVVSLHYNIVPDPSRQALHRAVEMEEMGRFSHEDIEVLRARLAKGRGQLRLARQGRPAPPVVTVPALSWRAETIRWLLAAADTATVDVPAVVAALERTVAGRFAADRGYLRHPGADDAWLEDQAALLAAFLAAHRATDAAGWLERARELADVILEHYRSNAGWLDRPGAEAPSLALVDDVIPATLETLREGLVVLAERTGIPGYTDRAGAVVTA